MIAIDCDLQSIYLWHEAHGHIGTYDDPYAIPHALNGLPRRGILYEIAGPAYAKHHSPVASRNFTRWSQFNMATAGILGAHYGDTFLVSPSSRWTKGYTVNQRHAIMECTAPNKHLRDCEAMIGFHRIDPDKWCTLNDYLWEIQRGKRK